MKGRTNVLLIQTPEGIAFPLFLAGPVTRFLAWIVDWACVAMASIVTGTLFGILRIFSWDVATAASIVCYFIVSIGYPIFSEWRWRGQTIGKRVLGLRVMDSHGLRLQFSQIVVRNLLRFVDLLPAFYAFGGIFAFMSRRSQRLGDLAANTIVVRTPQVGEPDIAQVRSDKYNSFRDYPHLVARLRQQIGAEEAGVALQAVLRRNQLDPLARIDLFKMIVNRTKQVVEFPQEATDGLTDEQYVRNVVELLFTRTAPR
jgi:uncharacterized RDD family membrane protein YckC